MKILYYNWVQFDDYKLRGGGVSVYLKSIIPEVSKVHDVYFISSGQHYDLFRKNPRIEKTKNQYGPNVHSFRILNSPIMAPAHDAFCSLDEYVFNRELYKIFLKFINKYEIDLIHFHNIEGITINILELKKDCPNLKIVYTAHNYHMICPQIELFQQMNCCNCTDFRWGWQCINCIGKQPNMYELMAYRRFGSFIERKGLEGTKKGNILFNILSKIYESYVIIMDAYLEILYKSGKCSTKGYYDYIKYKKLAKANVGCPEIIVPPSASYYNWRAHNIKVINKEIDVVIAVSSQVKDILIEHNIAPTKIHTVLNGTDQNSNKDVAINYWLCKENSFTIAFFGYEIPSKGLDLFLKAIESLDYKLISNIKIVIASRVTDKQQELINRLSNNTTIIHINGFKRSDIPSLMSTVTLGVIPSIWNETYCQTAAELISYGTPVIISDTVGIKDLYTTQNFIFKSNSVDDLREKLIQYINNPELLNKFWEQIKMPPSINEHVSEILKIYGAI